MSELAKPAGADLAPTAEDIRQFVEKPLRQLPADWRPVVWDFWSAWSHLLPTQLTLAARLRHWIRDEGLTLDDARAAFAAINKPARMAELRFASDLFAALGIELVRLTKERQREQHERERRERDAAARSGAVKDPGLRQMLESVGKGGGES
jgi:hypothetical protein